MQEIGDICDCRRPANTVDTKRVSFMHSRGALCHVKILIFFFGRRAGGGEASPVAATTYCDPRKIMHLFSLFNVDRDSFQKTVKGGNGGVLNKVFSLQCRRIFGGRNLFRGS